MNEKIFYTYIATNNWNKVLYTGMTNDIARRMDDHRKSAVKGFASMCNICKLVYVEVHETSYAAITNEKQIKGGSRKRKIQLIEFRNPTWKDLSREVF